MSASAQLTAAPNWSLRWQRLQAELLTGQALIVANPQHIRYLSSFVSLAPGEREAFLVVCQQQVYLLKTNFSPIPLEIPGLIVLNRIDNRSLETHLKKITLDQKITELLIDASHIVVKEWEILQKSRLKLTSSNLRSIDNLRMVKDEVEIELLATAGKVAAASWRAIQPFLKPGITELEIARHLEIAMLEAASGGPAFPTIVALEENAALPHHQPTNRRLQPNQAILIDFGATHQGYRSDMTRTVWIGDRPSDIFMKCERLVKQAYAAAITLLTPSHPDTPFVRPTAGQLDHAARQVIATAGYGAEFIHTAGHGLGLDIHEHPSLYQGQETPIVPGMVITIEPGIYLTGTMGYRYENTILVTETGYTELTATDGDFSV